MPLKKGLLIPIVLLGFGTISLGLGAEVLADYVSNAAYTLTNPAVYIEAVLGGDE